jgi:hypothetical protein
MSITGRRRARVAADDLGHLARRRDLARRDLDVGGAPRKLGCPGIISFAFGSAKRFLRLRLP